MLNTNIELGSNSQEVTFNTTSTGHLQKSNPQSRFIRFKKGSDIEKMVFPINGKSYTDIDSDVYPHQKKYVTILQILVFGDNYYLCEIIDNELLK